MNQAAVDASLKCVGTAYALNYTFAHRFARILHLFDASSESQCNALLGSGTIKFEFEGSGFVSNPPSDLSLAPNCALDERSHGKDNYVVANQILGKHCMDRITRFRCIGGYRRDKAYPHGLTCGQPLAAKGRRGASHEA